MSSSLEESKAYLPINHAFIGDGMDCESTWKKRYQIGCGAFSEVFVAELVSPHVNQTIEVAVKQIKISIPEKKRQKFEKCIETEINAVKILNHPRIVRFLGYCSQKFSFYLFMEHVQGGSLNDYIDRHGPLNEKLVKYFTRQLLEGVEYLHKQRIIHRDIKSANVLMADSLQIKLADFGVSKIFEDISRAYTSNIGTPRYMAPEMFLPGSHSYPVDIWAVGCVMLEMLTGKCPFDEMRNEQIGIYLALQNKTPLQLQEHLFKSHSIQIKEFLVKIFNKDPRQRPTSIELISDIFFIEDDIKHNRTLDIASNCERNPGHAYYKPIEMFCITDLPENFQDPELFQLLKTIGKLTPLISTHYVSESRPEFWPCTEKPYPFYEFRGSKTSLTGSGSFFEIKRYKDEMLISEPYCLSAESKLTTCSCTKCISSHNPSKSWAEIKVLTTASLVFNDNEAATTSVTFVFDDNDSKSYVLQNCLVYEKDIQKDFCCLLCVTCDENMIEKIEETSIDFINLNSIVNTKYISSRDDHRKVFLVSYPHGCRKHVSSGQWVKKYPLHGNESWNKFTYNASACPGSPGAHLLILGYSGGGHQYPPIHSGTLYNGLNFSSIGFTG